MGFVKPSPRWTKDGNRYTIRTAQVSDAEQMHKLTKSALKEGTGLVMSYDDFHMTVNDQMMKNDFTLRNPHTLQLIAVKKNIVIGILTIDIDGLKHTMHRGTLGVIIHPSYRSKGVGKALMTTALFWAHHFAPLEKLELEVLSSNQKAIKLYERLGFFYEGRIHRFMRKTNGEYEDILTMGCFLLKT
ncbi:GNAT family N-acetyltransferase [Bacillus shivajii]|uniref:GNAT family N-acetyltransferase n=1 Tax=Bacillus shivajii TaxID=1983719 RepID=UPI001CFAAE68|nr:GNAT family N-acetyltransferase [Bacillus shivajii]UCZ52030.1 GNAT family N-acetyltransferase [Bacillus shivajii]